MKKKSFSWVLKRGLIDDDEYVAMAGIDLSAAFDIVDVDLLIKILAILGLPSDVIELIKVWLKERYSIVLLLASFNSLA